MAGLMHWICDLTTTKGDHKCGGMLRKNAIYPRCQVYQETLASEISHSPNASYEAWYHALETIKHDSPRQAYARPRNLIHKNKLVDVPSHRDSPRIPYIAVSYTWAVDPEFLQWEKRRVTTQALGIAARLSRKTSLPLWIDAICIKQDDEKVKQEELPKMADIYRGAEAVVCLVENIGPETGEAVLRGAQVMASEAYSDLVKAGDINGCYLFATAGENKALEGLFRHRWWERAWTFQEAVLNPHTYLVGEADHTVPMNAVPSIAVAVRKRAASVSCWPGRTFLGREPPFWDSVSSMLVAAQRSLSLGEAIACVWRRNATSENDLVYSMTGVCSLAAAIKPSYKKPLNTVLRELFDAAVSSDDYTWVIWCAEVDQMKCGAGMGLLPTPEAVRASPFTGLTSSWKSASIPMGLPPRDGATTGVMCPFRSTGVIRSQTAPKSLDDTVNDLLHLGHSPSEIWDMLFGFYVGLMEDIGVAVSNDGIASPALNSALGMINGTQSRTGTASDMSGRLPFTSGISFMNYAVAAAETWLRRGFTQLVVVSTQGGIAAVPYEALLSSPDSHGGRVHILPVEPSGKDKTRRLVFVTTGEDQFRARATAVMILNPNAGSGKWQMRRIGQCHQQDSAFI